MGRCTSLDPPKSPLRRGTLIGILSHPLLPLVGAVPRVPALLARGDRILCSLIKNWYNSFYTKRRLLTILISKITFIGRGEFMNQSVLTNNFGTKPAHF